jgi:hypothetical protein
MKVNDSTLWLQGLLLDREGRQVQRLPLEMECAGEIKREQASQSNERSEQEKERMTAPWRFILPLGQREHGK